MIALVAVAISAVGWLNYRSLEQTILPRVLDRTETHSRLVAFDLQSHIRGARANLIIGCLLRAMVSHMFRRMAERFNSSCECRRELSVDEKPQSCAPQHGVIVLLRGELQDRGDVVGLEIGIVRQDLFAGGAGSQEIEHVLDADTQTANARTAATNVGTHRDALDRAHTMIVTWLVHEKEQYGG